MKLDLRSSRGSFAVSKVEVHDDAFTLRILRTVRARQKQMKDLCVTYKYLFNVCGATCDERCSGVLLGACVKLQLFIH